MLKDKEKIIKEILGFIVASLAMAAYIYCSRFSIKYPEPISISIGFTPVDLLILCALSCTFYNYFTLQSKLNWSLVAGSLFLSMLTFYMREMHTPGFIVNILTTSPLIFILLFFGLLSAYYILIDLPQDNKPKKFNINKIIAFVFAVIFVLAYKYTHTDDILGKYDFLMRINVFEIILVRIAYIYFYKYICARFKFNLLYLFSAIVFSATNIILNDIYKHQSFFYTIRNYPIIYACVLVIYSIAFYAGISYVVCYIEQNISGSSKNINIFKLALNILLLWSPIYLLFFPGAVSWESTWIINYVLGIGVAMEFAPAYYRIFISLFVHLGRLLGSDTMGVVIYFIVVGYISALAMAMIIKRASRLNLSQGIMQFMYIFCIANPFIILKTFTMQYDTLLGIALLYFSILLYDITLQGKNFVNAKNIILLFISGFMLCVFRNVGKAVLAISILVFSIYGIRKVGKKALLASLSLILALTTFILSNNALFRAMYYEPNDKLANFGIPLQQMSFVLKNHGLTALNDREHEILSSIVDPNVFITKANAQKVDSLKYEMESYFDEKRFSEENFKKLKSVWLSLGKRYPIEYIRAFVGSSILYFIPGHFDDYRIFEHYNHQTYHSRDAHSDMKHKLTSMPYDRAKNMNINSAFIGFTTVFGLYMSAGAIQLFALFIFFFVRQRKLTALCLLPSVFYALGTVFAPVDGWLRYMTPAGFVMPLFILYALYSVYIEKSRATILLKDIDETINY